MRSALTRKTNVLALVIMIAGFIFQIGCSSNPSTETGPTIASEIGEEIESHAMKGMEFCFRPFEIAPNPYTVGFVGVCGVLAAWGSFVTGTINGAVSHLFSKEDTKN